MKNLENKKSPLMNPYLAGVFLGLTLLASFVFLGAGLGASGGIARIGAFMERWAFPAHVSLSEYFGRWGENPLRYYLVFMLAGVFAGGLFSAISKGRVLIKIEKGKKASIALRVALSFIGGIIVGFASRLAGGCTSGQALSGGAMLFSGSLIFLVCIFIGGYAAAWFLRRQWND